MGFVTIVLGLNLGQDILQAEGDVLQLSRAGAVRWGLRWSFRIAPLKLDGSTTDSQVGIETKGEGLSGDDTAFEYRALIKASDQYE